MQETRAWERPICYVADDNQGNVGIVEFRTDGAIGAMSARAPSRVLDRQRAIGLAPLGLRDSLALISDLPLLQEGFGVSELFWSVGESMDGPESWGDMRRNGAALFEREVLSDAEWQEVGVPYYDLDPDAARVVIDAAARALVSVPILQLSVQELTLLVPKGSKHERLAVDLLTSEGLLAVLPVARK